MNRTNNSRFDGLPSWSPNGAKIAFKSDRSPHAGNFEIYTMNANGTSPLRITNHGRLDTTPSYSSDGTKLYFSANRPSILNFEIYSINPVAESGSNVPVNLTNHPAVDTLPD
jgi:TolB protein